MDFLQALFFPTSGESSGPLQPSNDEILSQEIIVVTAHGLVYKLKESLVSFF